MDIEKILDGIKLIEDEAHIYVNLYFINKDFRPLKTGTDNMGLMNHLHINNEFLKFYKEYGRDLLIRNRMA